jgi:hypothetical protein
MNKFPCWLQSSMSRVFPGTEPLDSRGISLVAPRGGKVSFQACVRNDTIGAVDFSVEVDCPDAVDVRVRRVGYVFIKHLSTEVEADELDGIGRIPGLAPDPLFPELNVQAGPCESHSYWVEVFVPGDCPVGEQTVKVRIKVGDERLPEMRATVKAAQLVLGQEKAFPVTHWFYADALCDWYKVEPYEERFWEIVEPYMRDLVEHGGKCQYVPIFTPPTDGVRRPHQLIGISEPAPGKYEFDFTLVKRWTDLATRCGAQMFEWTHFFWQWGVEKALRIYRTNSDPESLLWPFETSATSDVYRDFLGQFLPKFHQFLMDEGLLDKSLFHVSDEPHGDEHLANYRAARAMLKELAPWMKVSDAMSDIRYGKEGLTDIPIPVTSSAKEYLDAGIDSWVYFCCGPRGRYLNRLVDTPLAKIRMAGWLFYHLRAGGFLHWGYNYWYKFQTQQLIDPFTEICGEFWPNLPNGDTFVVYPGANGPISSIRWEVWGESLQDYAILKAAGIDPDDPRLSEIRDYDSFPKNEGWITRAREWVLLGSQ